MKDAQLSESTLTDLTSNQPEQHNRRGIRALRLIAIYIPLLLLLYFAVRNAPLQEIWSTLAHLQLWQILVLACVNAIVLVSMAGRWWLVVRAEERQLPFLPLIGYRLSVFGLSYFTLGPQVGGEPLQIIFLRHRHKVPFARATAAVILDKLLEFLGNFVFIGIGLLAIVRVGLVPETQSLPVIGWIVLLFLISWPPAHLVLLYLNHKPLTALLKFLLPGFAHRRSFRLMVAAEYLAASFTRRHTRYLVAALLASLVSWSGMALEYLMMLSFLEVKLNLWQALAGLACALLSFIVPLPGGLGALEASQVLALGAFGYSPATAISLTLLMRARDLINGGLGLWLAGGSFRRILQSAGDPARTGSSPL